MKDKLFKEVKQKAIEIWQTYDNTYGYVDEKLGMIKNIKNVGDNGWYIVSMFDGANQRKLYNKLSKEGKKWIEKLIILP